MSEQQGNLERAAEIFERASQLQGEARQRYLEGACGGDASLRVDIDSMMEAHAEQGEFLARPTGDACVTETRGSEQPGERAGTTIGRYKLLQRIGEGGFGVVYMAEQQEPVHRKVALKIIKLGMDTKQVIARFEAERQALAMMDHPNIARVFDAGATETGRPYFVMELVKGIPITEYCDKNNLSTKDRLDLFKPVCNAIQHAHQKGIIHRDIKPSNVMVTLHDGDPVPKVIDFGIAKATDHRLTEKTLFTEYRQLVGTPAYMSPEQAEMSGLDVDTRTDIYSLGVLLYELLTGTTPFDAEKLRQAAYGEIQRIIREVEPPKPSTRLSTLGADQLTGVARHRKAEPKSLGKLIRGDLDWIVMKALEKDRTRRYETAKELARDVEHHLANEPILAGPPAAVYKLRKFIKRNRVAVTAGSFIAAAIVIGLMVSMIGFVQASHQRDLAEAASREAEHARDAEAEQRSLAESERDLATKAKQEARQQAYFANIAAAGAALSMNEVASVRRRLEAAPEEFRNWEWRYLDAESDNSLAILPAPGHWVHCVAFSPDGKHLASGSTDGNVRLWDAVTGQELAVLQGHQGMVNSVVFSPNGRRLASASGWGGPASDDHSIRLWDALTGEQQLVLRGHEDGVWSIAFSPDGSRIASASWDETVRIWDLATGDTVAVLRGHEDEVYSAVFSPDGTRLASGSEDRTVRLWDPSTGAELLGPREHDDSVKSVAFSPDGSRLASALDDGTVHVWDLSTTEELIFLHGHKGYVSSVAFSPDGARLVSASSDRTVRVWNAATGQQLLILLGHQNRVTSVAFSPNGKRLASASYDGTVRIWDVTLYQKAVLCGREAAVRCVGRVTFSSDGARLASASEDNSVRLWDVSTGEELAVLRGHDDRVSSVAFSPDGASLATASRDNSARLWDADTGEEVALLAGHEGIVTDVSFSQDGTRLATASSDKTVRIWDASTGEELTILGGHERAVLRITFSPDGTRIASVSGWRGFTDDNTVRIWEVATGRELTVLTGHEDWIFSVAFSPGNNRVASAGRDRTVRLWNASTGEELACLKGHEESVFSVAFSPDSRRVASASFDGTVRIWDTSSGEQLLVLPGHTGGVVAFSPDGSRLASASDDGIRIGDSVPYRTRFEERETILAARQVAEGIVEDLWRQPIDARSIADRLRGDASLSEPQRRAALNLLLSKSTRLQDRVNTLLARLVFIDDVVAALEADDSLALGDRHKAVSAARARGDKPQRLNMDSWNLVCSARNHREAYQIGLRAAEAAVAQEPNNLIFLNTLGVAQYRNGRYEEAYATLTRCDQLRRQAGDAGWPRDVAMLAQVLFRLGRIGEARAMFERLEKLTHIDGILGRYSNATRALFEECKQLLKGSDAQGKLPESTDGQK